MPTAPYGAENALRNVDKSIAEITGIPMYKVRSSLREMFGVGFLGETEKDHFRITPIGEKVLKA